jgi:GT2 family glycosyltransferase
MSTELFSQSFRLRRAGFPRVKPQGGPFGYADGIGWLAPGLLWVDGWLSQPPASGLDVALTLGGQRLRRRAASFTAPAFQRSGDHVARRWYVVIPVGEGFATASRLQDLSLSTPWGELGWLGAYDRLIAADVTRYLRQPRLPAERLHHLRTFLARVVEEFGADPNDPLLRRNLAALHRAEEEIGSKAGELVAGKAEISARDVFGEQPEKPQVSVVITMLQPPDLLDHHYAHQRRGRGSLVGETIFVVGPQNMPAELVRRFDMLADLYNLPTVLLELKRGTTWAAAAEIGARHARGDAIAFYRDQSLGCETDGLATLVAPLLRDESPAGVTIPVLKHFDGFVRSYGFRVSGKGSTPPRLEALDATGGAVERHDVVAGSSECFAIRRPVFEQIGGFSQVFRHEDFESIDLCLRARAAGHPVEAVDCTVTPFVESARRPPLAHGTPSDRADYEILHQRHFTTAPTLLGEPRETPLSATVIIPTLNPGPELAEVLDRLAAQEGARLEQIVVIDSNSSDGTQLLLVAREIEHQVIERRDFNHGLTRNLGLERARGDVVVFLSQDALPEPGWLAGLMAAFEEPSVAGAYSRQVARQDASAYAVDRLTHWPAAEAEARRQRLPPDELFEAMSLGERLETICFDNVSSAIRRSVAERIPFRDLPFGEDRDWAYRAMSAGYTIRYCSDSRVVHSHDRSAWADLRRTVIDHRLINEMLTRDGEVTGVGTAASLLPAARRELLRMLDVAGRSPTIWGRMKGRAKAPARALVGVLGPFLGSNIARHASAGSRKWRWMGRVLTQ